MEQIVPLDAIAMIKRQQAALEAKEREIESLRFIGEQHKEEIAELTRNYGELCPICGWRFLDPPGRCLFCEDANKCSDAHVTPEEKNNETLVPLDLSDAIAVIERQNEEIATLKKQLGENQAELAVIKRDYEDASNRLVEARASVRMLINFVHDLSHLPKGWEMPLEYSQVAAQVLDLLEGEKP